jgi:membrane-associated phospholipid phosphatase
MKHATKYSKLFQLSFIFTITAIISIAFIDKPLAIYIHIVQLDNIKQLRLLSEYMPIIIMAICLLSIINYYRNKKLNLALSLIYIYAGLHSVLTIKTGFKILFGRYWPKTWINHNLSLIDNNVFGFNWLHGFGNQGSFPSGHSTYIAYCITWLFIYYPKQRYLWISIATLGIAPQVILDYHFFGDCMMGIALGIFFATLIIIIWQKYIELILSKYTTTAVH